MNGEVVDIGPGTKVTGRTPLSVRLYRFALILAGAALAGVSYLLAGWIVGLFSAALPIPAGTHGVLAAAAVTLVALQVAVVTDSEGQTLLDEVLWRVGR